MGWKNRSDGWEASSIMMKRKGRTRRGTVWRKGVEMKSTEKNKEQKENKTMKDKMVG
jgi:hypothetical protein